MVKDSGIVRWLHLSDFHVGKDDYASRKMFDYIQGHVRRQKNKGIVPDFLFITGDLAQDAQDNQYETFWIEFIDPLQKEIGGAIEQRTFAVPGNHDVDRTKHPAFSREEIAKPASRYLDPTGDGAKLREEMLIPRFRSYIEGDLTQDGLAFATDHGAYARSLTVNGVEVGIVGINTAWLSKDAKDERALTPGKSLLEMALGAVKSAELRIVLGHHPVDWFIPAQQKAIKSLLGQHEAIYLHGHLHDAWAEPTYGGGNAYLAIQSGAGFQAREGEAWKNGLVWGEVELSKGEVRLQGWRWISEQQDWVPITDAFHEQYRQNDWWHYPLPSNVKPKNDYTSSAATARLPRGWLIQEATTLANYVRPLDEGVALRFFDGAVPEWSTAISKSIPRRDIVRRLVENFLAMESSAKPPVLLLLAAACEGKSTALLQAGYAISEERNDWKILQRVDESQPLKLDEICAVLDENYRWLVIIDEADNAAADMLGLLERLPKALNGRVYVLLSCRDTDWIASNAAELNWSAVANFHIERLDGLDHLDAQAIVECWAAYGEAGLGKLADKPEAEWASRLEDQAKVEASTASGAFFGALLAVRRGAGLREHARNMLERLGHRRIPGGGDLRRALAYIAAMHAAGLEFLSRPVLSQVLNCPSSRLYREVLLPLGQEAAATTTSSMVFTRHRRIAETIVSVLREDFGEDVDALYVSLAEAAIDARSAGVFIPDIHWWRFDISDYFLSINRLELAMKIAQAALDGEPGNSRTRVHVANLFRRAGFPSEAIEVFRTNIPLVDSFRGYYREWSFCEKVGENTVNSVFVQAFAISDQYSGPQVNNKDARECLIWLGLGFFDLFNAYHRADFRDAAMSAAVLGLALHINSEIREKFEELRIAASNEGAVACPLFDAIRLLCIGIETAESIGIDSEVSELLPMARDFTFAGLSSLTSNSLDRKKRRSEENT